MSETRGQYQAGTTGRRETYCSCGWRLEPVSEAIEICGGPAHRDEPRIWIYGVAGSQYAYRVVRQLTEELLSARADITRLRDTLAVFAAVARQFDESWPDRTLVLAPPTGSGKALVLGHLRQAVAALAEQPAGKESGTNG